MLASMFGGKKKEAPQAPKPDAAATLTNLTEQCERVEKRQKVLDNQVTSLKNDAIAKKKAGDTRGALLKMKQMKMKEKEAAKLDGQLIMLEEQKMMIESTQFDVGVVQNLQGAASVVKDLNKQANVDDIAELQDELRDL